MEKHVKPLCIRLADNIAHTECSPQEKVLKEMYYDSMATINKIRIGEKCVPAVMVSNYLGTETVTQVRFEDTDQDLQKADGLFFATRTFTEAKAEDTDQDPSNFMCLGTQTFTKAKNENTDQDFH